MKHTFKQQNIPNELQAKNQWVLWKIDAVAGKVPYRIDDPTRKALSNAPNTWGSFTDAVAVAEREDCGIGFVLTPDAEIVVVDVDHGVPVPPEVEGLQTYSEISASGNGHHIFVRGKTKASHLNTKDVQIFAYGQFIAMTGDTTNGVSNIIAAQGELDSLCRRLRPPIEVPTFTSVPMTPIADKWVESAIKQRMALPLSGDDSSDDFALCVAAASFTDDADQIERCLRKVGPVRDKWDRKLKGTTYIVESINEALRRVSTTHADPTESANKIEALFQAGDRLLNYFNSPANIYVPTYFDTMQPGSVTMLTGASTLGKSTFANRMAMGWVAGVPMHEDQKVPKKGAVWFMTFEDTDVSLKDKQTRIKINDESFPATWAPLPNNFLLTCPEHKNFASFKTLNSAKFGRSTAEEYIAVLETLKKRRCADDPDSVEVLWVIDTLTQAVGSAYNELDSQQANEVAMLLQAVACATGAAVLLLHHPNKGDTYQDVRKVNPMTFGRGASALGAVVRSSIALGAVVKKKGGTDSPDTLVTNSVANSFAAPGIQYWKTNNNGNYKRNFFKLISPEEVGTEEFPDFPTVVAIVEDEMALKNVKVLNYGEICKAIKSSRKVKMRNADFREKVDEVLTWLTTQPEWVVAEIGSGRGKRVSVEKL